MVGVKGKYKGCNTCRRRRVTCDNTRPFCKKCTDHDRVCEGYQQETVFIVGTVDDKGRCASHPPRNLLRGDSSKNKRTKTSASASVSAGESEGEGSGKGKQVAKPPLEFSAVPPLQSAWDEGLALASVGGLHRMRFVALHTTLETVMRTRASAAGDDGNGEMWLSLGPSRRADVRPSFTEEDFKLNAQGFVYLPLSDGRQGSSSSSSNDGEGICLFLYEQNSSAAYSNKAPWKDPLALNNMIRQLGPDYFKTFPEHHFFTRIYRPSAIFTSLLTHTPTPFSSAEWHTVPWELHPQHALDALLDIVSSLPALLARLDRILPLAPSISRRLKANDLLPNCAALERRLEAWYAGLEEAAAGNREWPLLCWIAEPRGAAGAAQIPFADTFAFPSWAGGLAHVYYWTALIVLYGCMSSLVDIITYESGDGSSVPGTGSVGYGSPASSLSSGGFPVPPSVVESTGSYYTTAAASQGSGSGGDDLPSSIDPAKYGLREIRRLAANICRSLDWVIGSNGGSQGGLGGGIGQPDLVAAPLCIVEGFYEGIRGDAGDGDLERLWCQGFRARYAARATEMERAIGDGSKGWIDIGRFG